MAFVLGPWFQVHADCRHALGEPGHRCAGGTLQGQVREIQAGALCGLDLMSLIRSIQLRRHWLRHSKTVAGSIGL